MDWLGEIGRFPSFDLRTISPDVPSKEALIANSKYYKALKNAQNDSVDIAIIELRKLYVLYPEAGQMALLLGCCQAYEERYEDALRSFTKASRNNLPLDIVSRINNYSEFIKKEIEARLAAPVHKNKPRNPALANPEIAEKSRSSRWKNHKVASEKEKREVMNGMNSKRVSETFVTDKMQINWLKVGIVSIIAILAVVLIYVLAVTVPNAVKSYKIKNISAETKLEWLLNELNSKDGKDSEISDILKSYDAKFYPTPKITETAKSEPNSNAGTITPKPTPTKAVSPVADKVQLAATKINEAQSIAKSNPKTVYTLIKAATEILNGVDENAAATTLPINAGEVLTKAENLMKSVVNPACYYYYSKAKATINNALSAKPTPEPAVMKTKYAEAIDLFVKAYDIYPGYLDGGNAYNLGKAYAAIGQVQNANEMFRFVVKTFPGTDVAGWAADRIKPVQSIGE
jgi:tetratricopeptide (TPR) repeat protein